MDYPSAVQQRLSSGEKCHSALLAGLVLEWVKESRVLALVEYRGEFSLFVFSSIRFPIVSSADLMLQRAFPIDSFFHSETEILDGTVKSEHIFLKLRYKRLRLLFVFPFVPETIQFINSVGRVADAFLSQTKPVDFSWLRKYQDLDSVSDPFADDGTESSSSLTASCESTKDQNEENQVQMRRSGHSNSPEPKKTWDLESPDSFKDLPRKNIAIGKTPLAARDSVIKLQMTMREDDYTNIHIFRIFIGTWNVNGTPPGESLLGWLASDPEPPDIYAVGFQELDLNKEAYLFSDSPREGEWLQAVQKGLHPKAKYKKVKLIRLVGMMLIIFIQEKHSPSVTNVVAETIGTGILGIMGNKGGVAVRFDLHNTSLCFVNSHLAAHADECERRNQDFNDICSRMIFSQFIPPKTIKNHDQIFWLGDLNYRLNNLDADMVKRLIDNKEYALLLDSDQLKQQRNWKKIFVGFEEGEINFPPTYKYDPGSDNWDTSDKCRTPAWCDRILWKGKNMRQLVYRSHKSFRISDHKPVSSMFQCGIKVIDVTSYRRIYEEVMKKLDKLENEFLPQVAVDSTELTFTSLRFIEPQVKYLTIANTGQVPVQFEFIKKPNDSNYCKEWLKIKPYTSFIMPGEKCDIEFEVYIDKYTVPQLNSAKDTIYDILVLHLEGGKDIFITVSGNYDKTCFGICLERLVTMRDFVRESPVGKLIDVDSNEVNEMESNECYDIPKEVWLLVDHLYKYARHQEHLFEQPGLHSEIQQIREYLDTGIPNKIPGSVYSVAETLLLFLEALPEPVIPFSFYTKCLENANNFVACKQLLTQIPAVHRRLFRYLMLFLRELMSHSEQNKLDHKTISTIFGTTLIRCPRVGGDEESRAASSSQMIIRKKSTFVYHFLVNEYDG